MRLNNSQFDSLLAMPRVKGIGHFFVCVSDLMKYVS